MPNVARAKKAMRQTRQKMAILMRGGDTKHLTSVHETLGTATPTSYAYTLDAAGNRIKAVEADDALASATARFQHDAAVEQIVLCSTDKDLAQLVSGAHIVGWDRRRNTFLDEAGVVAKFGVRPHSIPGWLALVGDAADGFPGIPGWGAKSAAAVLTHYEHLEAIPADPQTWHTWGLAAISDSRAARLAESLTQHWDEALLFRTLATLRADVPVRETLAELEWQGADERLQEVCHRLGDDKFPGRVPRWRKS